MGLLARQPDNYLPHGASLSTLTIMMAISCNHAKGFKRVNRWMVVVIGDGVFRGRRFHEGAQKASLLLLHLSYLVIYYIFFDCNLFLFLALRIGAQILFSNKRP